MTLCIKLNKCATHSQIPCRPKRTKSTEVGITFTCYAKERRAKVFSSISFFFSTPGYVYDAFKTKKFTINPWKLSYTAHVYERRSNLLSLFVSMRIRSVCHISFSWIKYQMYTFGGSFSCPKYIRTYGLHIFCRWLWCNTEGLNENNREKNILLRCSLLVLNANQAAK